ncbi:MAG: SMC-Scp complex subunit ScpB [Halieaceae bacterium]|nr:SMC-Scp complex subunit ScpB [Halieaceae bacterium]
MEQSKLLRILEGVLLAAGAPLSVSRIRELFDERDKPAASEIRDALKVVSSKYSEAGFELKEVASGFRFQIRDELSPWISKLWQERPQKYSRALLETLSLIAYRQPITRGEIEEIRGVSLSSSILRTLHEREWVRVVGHRDVPGRPSLYATTRNFLDYFNLKSLDQLPALADVSEFESLTGELELEQKSDSELTESEHEVVAQVHQITNNDLDASDMDDIALPVADENKSTE